jgi:hypothetical protein
MPDFGWAYINLDVLQNIEGPANVTGTIAIVKDSTTLSGSKFLAYATGTSKVGVGLDFPSVLPTSQLHISASAGEQIAVTIDGDLSASSNISASFFYGDGSKLQNVGGGGSPGGSNTQVQFNDGGSFGGSSDFVWDGTTLSVTGNISGSGVVEVGGNLTGTHIVPNTTLTYDLGSTALEWNRLYVEEVIGDIEGAIRFDAVNDEGDSISRGQVVYIKGVTGQTPTVALAAADDSNKMPAFGLAAANAAQGANVQVVTFGSLQNLNLSTLFPDETFVEGDPVFVQTGSGGVSGSLTAVAPTGSNNLLQNIGQVVRNGVGGDNQIKVGGAGRSNATPNLDEGYIFIGNSSDQAVQDNTVSVISSTSRVGINAPSPTHTLTVGGAISGSSTLQIVGTINSTGDIASSGSISGSAGELGSITVGGSTHTNLVDVSGTPSNGQLALWSDANTIQGSTSLTYDGSTLTNDNNLSGSGTFQNVGAAIFGDTLQTSGSLTGSDTLYVEASSNRVGINRPTPDAMLHLSQSGAYPQSMLVPVVRVDHVGDADSGGGGGPTTTPILILTGTAPSGEDFFEGQLSINKSSPAGALHVSSKGTDTLVANQGKVAIGHSGPGSVLDVRGESQLYRVVNTKSDYENIIMFVTGGTDGAGHFGSFETGSTFHVSGTSFLTTMTASVGVSSSVGNFATLNINSVAIEGGTVDGTTIGGTTPDVVNQTGGSVKYRSKAAGDSPYAVLDSDYIIGVDTTAGAVEIDLQAGATAGTGRMLIIKDVGGNAGTNNITIDPNGTEKIDGQSTLVIAANSGSAIIFCDGTDWYIAGTR